MKRGQSALNYFVDRVQTIRRGGEPITGTSGLWQVKVEQVMVPMLQATAVHPEKRSVKFRAKDARELAWKLVGVQINMKPFQWDHFPENTPTPPPS